MSPDAFARIKIRQKCVCGQVYAPDPTGGAHSAPQASTGFREWEGEGRKGEAKGKDRKGEDGREREGTGRETRGRGREEGMAGRGGLLRLRIAFITPVRP